MPEDTPVYDLMLLLSMSAPEEQRAKILADVEAAISAGGGVIARKADWGRRAMTYQIKHQSEAAYHLIQLSAPPSLLDSLSYTLRITDGVLRFRIIKVLPGTPPLQESPPPVLAPAAAVSGQSEPSAAE
jgi:small subunit ribosomal protein S6